MANASSDALRLRHAVRRGVMPTKTVPQTAHVMQPAQGDDGEVAAAGAAHDGIDPEDLNVMAGLLDDATGAPPAAPAAPRASRPAAAPAAAGAAPAAPAKSMEAPSHQPPAAVPVLSARAARYGAAVRDPLGAAPAAAAPRAAASSQEAAGRPWAKYADAHQAPEAVSARQAMAAAKVLTPLVAAVSFKPGTGAHSKELASTLATMLTAVHRTATDVAEAWSAKYGRDVPRWCVNQLMQGVADVIARRWERDGFLDPERLRDVMIGLLNDERAEVAAMIVEAADNAYAEVQSKEDADNRVAISTAGAAWTLYDWVMHERLSLDDKGEMPSRFYTYGREPHEIVSRMLTKCVAECRGLVINVSSVDLRTAHLQAAIGRMARLMGAEYVTQTRVVMNWIASAEDDATFEQRKKAASDEFETRTLPHVFEWARVQFLRIEQSAHRAIEELHEKDKTQLPGGGSSRRPGAT